MLTPFDVQGRLKIGQVTPKSQSLAKPNQPHRIVKDKVGVLIESQDSSKHTKATLQPISARDSAHSYHGSQSSEVTNSLPNILDKSPIGNNNEVQHMKRTIKDLEKENYRLCHHVKQAEQSIRSYRSALSNNNHQDNKPISCDIGMQTDGERRKDSERALQSSLPDLSVVSVRNSELLLQNKQMEATNKQLEAMNKQLKDTASNTQAEHTEIIRKLQLTITSQQREISKLTIAIAEAETETAAAVAVKPVDHPPVSPPRIIHPPSIIPLETHQSTLAPKKLLLDPSDTFSSLAELRRSLQVIKTDAQSTLTSFSFSLNTDFKQLLNEVVITLRAESRPLEERISQLVKDKHQSEIQMNKMNQDLTAARNEMTALVRLHQKQLQLSDPHQVLSPHAKLSPSSHNTPNGKGGHILTGSAMKHTARGSPVPSHNPISPVQKTGSSLEAAHRIEALLNQLNSASVELINLQVVHAAEVKAVQHVSHVKELQRVAKEREALLDRDRLLIENKHLKEVQSILVFSINTAEQSLNETQPHVVAKLVEGRKKRLKLLEHSIGGRMREIDQRSKETCAVNSAHLEGFQKKASENSKVAELMTKAAVAKLTDMLRVET